MSFLATILLMFIAVATWSAADSLRDIAIALKKIADDE